MEYTSDIPSQNLLSSLNYNSQLIHGTENYGSNGFRSGLNTSLRENSVKSANYQCVASESSQKTKRENVCELQSFNLNQFATSKNSRNQPMENSYSCTNIPQISIPTQPPPSAAPETVKFLSLEYSSIPVPINKRLNNVNSKDGQLLPYCLLPYRNANSNSPNNRCNSNSSSYSELSNTVCPTGSSPAADSALWKCNWRASLSSRSPSSSCTSTSSMIPEVSGSTLSESSHTSGNQMPFYEEGIEDVNVGEGLHHRVSTPQASASKVCPTPFTLVLPLRGTNSDGDSGSVSSEKTLVQEERPNFSGSHHLSTHALSAISNSAQVHVYENSTPFDRRSNQGNKCLQIKLML